MVNPTSEFFSVNKDVQFVDQSVGQLISFGPVTQSVTGSEPWGTLPHTAWFDMSQYYITAFKTGSFPAITVSITL